MAPRLATQQGKDQSSKSTTTWDAYFARLRAAEQLLTAGRRTEGATQLERARSFYQQVAASAYLRDAEVLSTASA
jgi:hypothetical protein